MVASDFLLVLVVQYRAIAPAVLEFASWSEVYNVVPDVAGRRKHGRHQSSSLVQRPRRRTAENLNNFLLR